MVDDRKEKIEVFNPDRSRDQQLLDEMKKRENEQTERKTYKITKGIVITRCPGRFKEHIIK